MNETARRYAVSTAVTFLTGFAMVLALEIDNITLGSLVQPFQALQQTRGDFFASKLLVGSPKLSAYFFTRGPPQTCRIVWSNHSHTRATLPVPRTFREFGAYRDEWYHVRSRVPFRLGTPPEKTRVGLYLSFRSTKRHNTRKSPLTRQDFLIDEISATAIQDP